MSVRILQGDVRDMLDTLDDESVHCVVTSPPYWGLRDYGVEGQLGMEPTMGEHIDTMVDVFREVRRVLRKDGTCWLNYGDCYANDGKWGGSSGGKHVDALHGNTGIGRRKVTTGLKPKDLCMIPNRLAIALQDDGWWIRSEIIWAKPNPMPESVTDRPATAHEKIWLLSKSARYWYDSEAVRTESSYKQKWVAGWATGDTPHNATAHNVETVRKTDKQRGHSRRHAGFNDRWDAMPKAEQLANGANLRNVWTIPTKGFSGAHYATFPPDLIVPCIKAGCPKGGTVLDPFIGSGTTAMVADRLGRDCIGIDLNPANVEMSVNRIADDAGMFAEVSA